MLHQESRKGCCKETKPDMGYPVTTSKPSQTAAQTRTDGLFGGVQGMIGSASHEKIERTAGRKCQDRRSRFNAGCRFPIMAGHGRWVLFNGRELAAHTRATEQFWKEQWTEGGGKDGNCCLARRKDRSNSSANVAFGKGPNDPIFNFESRRGSCNLSTLHCQSYSAYLFINENGSLFSYARLDGVRQEKTDNPRLGRAYSNENVWPFLHARLDPDSYSCSPSPSLTDTRMTAK